MTISPNERAAAGALIERDFPEFKDQDKLAERVIASNTVASAAKALMQKNPALDWQEALSQAYVAERGNFRTESKMLGGRKVKFEDGTSPQTARAAPPLGDRKAGKYYYNDKGAIGKWTGKGWEPVGASSSSSQASADEEDDDEGDDNE